MTETLRVEAEGETVGEAKWRALRDLELMEPLLDRAAVQFDVLSEGKRGLLGVGYEPARVAASADRSAARGERAARADGGNESEEARRLRARVSQGSLRGSPSRAGSRSPRPRSRSRPPAWVTSSAV